MTTSPSESLRYRWWLTLAAGLLLCGCSRSRLPDEPVPRQMRADDERSVLGLRVNQPAIVYALARHALVANTPAGAGRFSAMPQSLPLLVVSVLGLPPLAAGRLAEHGDWLGLISRTPSGTAAWAAAVPLHSGREFIAEHTLGANAPRRAVERQGFVELQGPNVGILGAMCVGVTANRLVFGSTCFGVQALAGRLTGEQSIAPTTTGPGLGLRLFAGRSVLQGLYALWGDHLWQLLGTFGGALDHPAVGALSDGLTLFNTRVSAYLGHVDSGEATIELDTSRLVVEGSLRAASLPVPRQPRSLCKALSLLPSQTRFWMAGIGEREPTSSPDWESVAGAWERNVVKGLAFTLEPTSADDGVDTRQLASAEPRTSGQWVIGAREGAAGLALFALLAGQTPTQVEAVMPKEGVAGRATSRRHDDSSPGLPLIPHVVNRDGKALEWGVIPWGDGAAVAVGAPLGDEWQRWSTRLNGPASEPITRAVPCQVAVGGIGSGRGGVELVVVRAPEGLELKGSVDVTGQWSTP